MSGKGVSLIHIVENSSDNQQFNGASQSIIAGGAMGNTALDGQAWTIGNYNAGPPPSFDIASASGNGTWVYAQSYMNPYNNQTHVKVSADGSVAAWSTNFGIPQENSAVDVQTGFRSTTTSAPPRHRLRPRDTIGAQKRN